MSAAPPSGPFRRVLRNVARDPALAVALRSVQGRFEHARHRRDLDAVERFVVFVGYPRSGHTLVGSLLNAHPEVVIANELDALGYVAQGVSRRALLGLIVARDRAFERAGRRWTGYDYRVPGQWQGRWRQLRVIGDKEAGRSAFRLERRPYLLTALERRIDRPLVVIHVARHPLDIAARMAIEQGRPVDDIVPQLLGFARATADARAAVPADRWLDVRLEDLVADPRTELARLVAGLGLEAGDDYLDACAAIVAASARRTRDEVWWPASAVDALAVGVASYPVLGSYGFGASEAPVGGLPGAGADAS